MLFFFNSSLKRLYVSLEHRLDFTTGKEVIDRSDDVLLVPIKSTLQYSKKELEGIESQCVFLLLVRL